ncbi:hypothetical protein R1flu_003813 [Riccia fluitans]|uniref:Ubiquitin-like protease family profile domain-containing protein n=1 Tax=Riccia fluitans TaxID=41844 RepID=A0ABD1YA24_9MARC
MLSNILEHHGRANQRLVSLEEDQVHAKREKEKLKATIEALEKEKSEMNAIVALMVRKDLYELLEAKMEGFQIANHPRTIGGFENLNLTITGKWVEISVLNLEEFEKCPTDYSDFVRWHRTLQDKVDRTSIDVYYSSLLDGLKATTGTLPNSLAIFDYIRSIFDSYVNPTNDPNVQPLVKRLDADDFSVDKFFGLQDPTSPDDVQASPDFEEDLRTNERLRLRAEIRNLGAEPQQLTRSTRVRLDYEPTILPDIPPTDNPARPITLDLTVDAREDPSSPPQSQIVPVLTFVDLTQYMSSPENKGSEDQGWPCKEDLMKEDLESAIELVARYDKTNYAEEAMIKITRLWKSICPKIRDEDMKLSLPTWIFVPIHGKNHWSLAIIRIKDDLALLAHLDSFQGTHDPKATFHALRTVLCLIMPIDPALVQTGIMNLDQQEYGHSCGKHMLQMLAGAGMKESNLDRYFFEEGLSSIATLDQVRSLNLLFPMYLSSKLAHPCNYNLK